MQNHATPADKKAARERFSECIRHSKRQRWKTPPFQKEEEKYWPNELYTKEEGVVVLEN